MMSSVGVRWGVPVMETCWNSIATVSKSPTCEPKEKYYNSIFFTGG